MTALEPRGFPDAEFETRHARLQAAMTGVAMDAVVVTSPPNVRYFSGFATEFWESPTRPWFVVLPRDGAPVAVVPEIGGPAFASTWINDVRTWPAPRPEDDGVSDLAATLSALPRRFGRIGFELGREMSLRMPVSEFERLRGALTGLECVDAAALIWSLRMVKSAGEVERIRLICDRASDAFEAMPGKLRVGDSERVAANKLRLELAERDVDAVPFIAACSGHGGYRQIIVGSTEEKCDEGTILIMDLGATWDGYFCDFDRNFAFGPIPDAARRAHETVWQATEAGIAAARPGVTTSDIFHAQNRILEEAGASGSNVGRLGHGLGLQLTEPPSHTPGDATPLVPGMVLTIEPGFEYAPGRMIVHEENIVVTEGGCELLTRRAPREMWVVER